MTHVELNQHKPGSRQASAAARSAWTGASTLVRRMPAAMLATRAGARTVTKALQTLPDRRLRWLAATSVSLGAGLYVAGAPRLVVAAGVAPAVFMGAAILSRPINSELEGAHT